MNVSEIVTRAGAKEGALSNASLHYRSFRKRQQHYPVFLSHVRIWELASGVAGKFFLFYSNFYYSGFVIEEHGRKFMVPRARGRRQLQRRHQGHADLRPGKLVSRSEESSGNQRRRLPRLQPRLLMPRRAHQLRLPRLGRHGRLRSHRQRGPPPPTGILQTRKRRHTSTCACRFFFVSNTHLFRSTSTSSTRRSTRGTTSTEPPSI